MRKRKKRKCKREKRGNFERRKRRNTKDRREIELKRVKLMQKGKN
jgi:hypothetical protein